MTKHPRFSAYDRISGIVCEFANKRTKTAVIKKLMKQCGSSHCDYADFMNDYGYILLEHHTYVVPKNKTSLLELQRICGVKIVAP